MKVIQSQQINTGTQYIIHESVRSVENRLNTNTVSHYWSHHAFVHSTIKQKYIYIYRKIHIKNRKPTPLKLHKTAININSSSKGVRERTRTFQLNEGHVSNLTRTLIFSIREMFLYVVTFD